MGDLKCPDGMVLIKSGGPVHPDEPAFCIGKTEVTQAADNAFWVKQQKSGYEKGKPQPTGNLAGPKKAATLRTWKEAMKYCEGTYPRGTLPTDRQWEKACGDKEYCTASGKLTKSEADYGKSEKEGLADVDAFPANPNGVQGMTGGVWEWIRDNVGEGFKSMRGGSWVSFNPEYLRAAFGYVFPDDRNVVVGFRCVASPLDSKK